MPRRVPYCETRTVLAVDQTASQDKDQPVVVRAVTLEVTPKQAEVLVKAREEGRIQLTLRHPLDIRASTKDDSAHGCGTPWPPSPPIRKGACSRGASTQQHRDHHSRHQCAQLRILDMSRAMPTNARKVNALMISWLLPHLRTAALACVAAVIPATILHAQEPSDQVVHAERYTTLTVPIYKSRVVSLPTPAKRVSIGNPDIADVLIIGAGELYILGKDLGATNVLLWDRDERLISSLSVFVTHDLEGLRQTLAAVLPGEKIQDFRAHSATSFSPVRSPARPENGRRLADRAQLILQQAATRQGKDHVQGGDPRGRRRWRGQRQERRARSST